MTTVTSNDRNLLLKDCHASGSNSSYFLHFRQSERQFCTLSKRDRANFEHLKMKEECLGDSKQRAISKLSDQNHPTRFGVKNGSNALKPRDNAGWGPHITIGLAKDKKNKVKTNFSDVNVQTKRSDLASLRANETLMVFGKVEATMGVQNGPPVPYLDIPDDIVLASNKQSVASSRQGSKFQASENSSRVKRSLIGDFPRTVNHAQVHPQTPECDFTKCDDLSESLELGQLRMLVKELKEREAKLQSEVLEYEWLKEAANRIPELENELNLKRVENENLSHRIGLLEAEKHKMSEEIAHFPILTKEIEEARAKIKDLQNQMLPKSVQCNEEISKQDVANTEKRLKELDIEIVELRRLNMELQHQKRELASKLATAESQIISLGKFTESDMVAKVEAEASILRHTNEDLCKQVEGLQMNRFSEVEELVYLRWVNSCLRYELRNSDITPGKASAVDLNETLSPKSQYIAKQLMLEYAVPELPILQGKRQTDNDSESLSSYSSNMSEPTEIDDLSMENFPGRISSSKKSSLVRKLKKWTKSSDDWQLLPSEYLSDKNREKGQLGIMSPRRRHSISGPKESMEHLVMQNRREAVETSKPNNLKIEDKTRAPSLDSTDFQNVKFDRFEELNKSLLSKDKSFERTIDIPASFQLISKTVSGDLEEKYPAFKDRHKLITPKVEQGAPPKVEQYKIERPTLVAKQPEVTKMTPAEVEKRALRIPKPPPKPSTLAAATTDLQNGSISVMPPPPPPLPPPPLRHGVKGAPPPPPPPPPPPKFSTGGGNVMQRAPEVVEFYQSLMKRDAKKESSGGGITDAPDVANARSSMIGEIENRSSHLLAIKADVETQGDFVRSLIREVRSAVYTNIEDVVAFVKWLDDELSFLVDERAVLKHFDWPERKADAMREAAFGYRDLKKLESEVSSYEDDLRQPCNVALKKMLALLEKSEQTVYNLLRVRDMAMARYKEFQISTDWMLDTGIVSKIKFASVKLAKKYMKRVAIELESMGCSEKEPAREFLLLQGVRFAFRVHQFAGGFDGETMRAFEELRNLAHMHHKKSQEQEYAGLPAQ